MKTIYLGLLTLLIIFAPATLNAQPNLSPSSPEYDRGWFTMGVGGDSNFELSGLITANFGRDRFWEANLYSAANFCFSNCPAAPGITALSMGRGYSIVDRIGRISFSVGPSIAHGKKTYSETENFFWTAGLFTNSQFLFTPVKEIGIGIDMYANMNPKLSTFGSALVIVIEGHK